MLRRELGQLAKLLRNVFSPESRHPKVPLHGVHMGKYSGKLLTKSAGLTGEGGAGPEADDAVRMAAEDVVTPGVQLRGLDQPDGEIVPHVTPESPASEPVGQACLPSSSVTGLDVPEPPHAVQEGQGIVGGGQEHVDQEAEAGGAKHQERKEVGGDCRHLGYPVKNSHLDSLDYNSA